MEFISFFPKIITEFEKWYDSKEHTNTNDDYRELIEKSKIISLNDVELIEFFYNFVAVGGKVQSGGERTKNPFKESISRNIKLFKSFILEPFNTNFNFEDWFIRIADFKYFGVGIATIYLNRINDKQYSILNNKTIKTLRELGFNISSSKNLVNYKKVNEIQNEWILNYPSLNNLYKVDAINEFLIGSDKGRKLLSEYVYMELIEDTFEQNEIIENENDFESLNKNEILQIILDKQKNKDELIKINNVSYKRNNYVMALIKKYRDYTCQFCSTTILKESGDYYIEACHIKPKAEGGKDVFENILILCPNCHKLFDYAKREKVTQTNEIYEVKLNGKLFKAILKN